MSVPLLLPMYQNSLLRRLSGMCEKKRVMLFAMLPPVECQSTCIIWCDTKRHSSSQYTLSITPIINTPSQHTFSTHHFNTPSQPTLSTHPLNTPYQSTLSTHPINTPSQHTLSIHPLNPPYQHTFSTHPLNTPYQSTLSTHPINTPYQSTLSTHHFNPPYQPTFSTHPLNTTYQPTPSIGAKRRHSSSLRATQHWRCEGWYYPLPPP